MQEWLESNAAYFTLGYGLLTIGLLLLLRGWIGRRTKGRPLCRSCDYDLTGGSLTCPECGRVHKHARDLLRPRRFWKRAGLGFVLSLIAGYALFWPDISHRREKLEEPWYLAIVPTTA